ncbi:MAG: hypothetical protein R3191_01695 [Anaerolineales bacterium]|nr:hypothetical protein [Anaerolineales bacterium]
MSRNRTLLLTVAFAVLLAACGTSTPAPTAIPSPVPQEPTQPAPTEAVQPATPQPTAQAEPTAEGLGPIPEGPRELRASNPSAVQLANGEPTLVEFFAFW